MRIAYKSTAAFTLAICVFAFGAVGSVKNPVTRPIRVQGHVTAIINLTTGELQSGGPTAPNFAVGTHTGSSSNVASGNFFTGEIDGTVTAANGDQIFWMATGPESIGFTGGTGRFEGITDGFTFVMSNETVTFPDANTMVISYDYLGIGTATY